MDLLPTLAEIAGAKIPATFPGREPTPLAGISLTPIFAGEKWESRPPIHLLFGADRGLRDGDWKLVSYKSLPWELYDMSKDRTELNNLAAAEPGRVAAMSKRWHEIAKETMDMDAKPVAAEDKPKTNAEWSDYSGRKKPKRKK